MKFEGQVALITGAAVGIGRATALEMAREGATLILLDMNPETLAALQQELAQLASRVLVYACDISDEEAVNKIVADALEKTNKIDILVNNAGIWRGSNYFLDITPAEWKKYFDVNMMGTVYATRAVLPSMLERGYGRIVNVASVAGVYGNAKMSHYSASKGAMIAFTKALASELGYSGIRVNAVSPGVIDTKMNACFSEEEKKALCEEIPLGRMGLPKEIAAAVVYFASDDSAYTTGQILAVSGGFGLATPVYGDLKDSKERR